jgi:hypothetical protein
MLVQNRCIGGALFQDAGDDSIARFSALFSMIADGFPIAHFGGDFGGHSGGPATT